MPPKPLPLAASAGSASSNPNLANPSTISTATAAAIAKKSPLKRKSSVGSTDSKSVKKKKTNVKAAKPGASTVKPLSSIIKAKEEGKKKNSPKIASKQSSSSGSPKSASKTASKTASPTKTNASSSSTTNKSKTTKSTNPTPQSSKLLKAQQIKRDIAHLDSIERAFRQDREVWCPPEPTGGWMYRTGGAEVGGNSWMNAVNRKESQHTQHQRLQQQPGGLLFDETILLQNALSYNNLSLSSLTPEAHTSLLEQARRYALELLVDAQDYAMHASRTSVASLIPADLLLAAEMRGDVNGVPSTLPRFEDMMDYASDVNRKPLPPIPVDCYNGVALPPVEEQLTLRTFDVVNGAKVVQKMMKGGELPLDSVEVGLMKRSASNGMDSILAKKSGDNDVIGGELPPNSSKIQAGKNTASYGAGKGRQIAIRLKDNTEGTSSLGVSNNNGGESSGKLTASKGGSKNKRKLTEL